MEMTDTNTASGAADLRAALEEACNWFESQAKAVSKGCGSSYELHDLQTQRDAIVEALASAPALPEPIGVAHIHESGELISAHSIRFHVAHNDEGDFDDHDTKIYTADQMRAFADATHALRASHGQAPAGVLEDGQHDAE